MNEHKGYPNYETWAIATYLYRNYTGEGNYWMVRQQVKEILKDSPEFPIPVIKEWLASKLDDLIPNDVDSILRDLLTHAISKADFHLLARELYEEVSKELKQEIREV